MNPVDLLAVVLFVVAVALGIRSGALPQLLGLAGAAVAAIAGLAIVPIVTPFLDSLSPGIRAIAVLSVLLGLVGLGEGLGATAGRAMSQALGEGFFGALDRVGGALVGAAQAVLILWLAGGVIAIPARELGPQCASACPAESCRGGSAPSGVPPGNDAPPRAREAGRSTITDASTPPASAVATTPSETPMRIASGT